MESLNYIMHVFIFFEFQDEQYVLGGEEVVEKNNERNFPSLPEQGKLHSLPRVIYSMTVVPLCWLV